MTKLRIEKTAGESESVIMLLVSIMQPGSFV